MSGLKRRLGMLLLITEAEWATLPLMAAAQALLVAGLVYGLSACNSLFTQRVGAASLPLAFILSAIAMLLATPPVVWLTGRVSRRAGVWLVYGLLAAALVAVRLELDRPWALWAFFVVAIVAGGFTMLVFWSAAAALYDPRQAKRLFPIIGAGGSVGAIAAGATAGWITGGFGTESLAIAWAACLVAAALLMQILALPPTMPSSGPSGWRALGEGGRLFTEVPVAFSLAAVTGLMVLVSWIVGYHFNVAVMLAFPTEAAFAAYFAQVAGAISLLCLVAQLFLVGRFMQGMGIVGTMATPPALILVPVAAMAFQLNLVLATAARFLDQLFQITLVGAATDSVSAAIPVRWRDSVMALLRAVVSPLAMALAGLLLMATERGGVPEWVSRALLPVLVALWLAAVAGLRRRYVETLMRNLASDDEAVRLTSLSALEGLTTEGVSLLLGQALSSGREDLQVFALQMLREPSLLGWASGPGGMAAEVGTALTSPSAEVRREAVETLAHVSPTAAADALPACLEDPSREVRLAAASAAGRLSHLEPLRERMLVAGPQRLAQEDDPEVRGSLVLALGRCGWDEAQVVREVEGMALRAEPFWRCAAALALPSPLSDAAEEVAWKLLGDEDVDVRRTGARSLRGPFNPATAAALLRLLRDPDTAEAAALGLRTAGGKGVSLLRAALTREDAATRARLCDILGAIGGPEVVAALLERLADPSAAVREAAALGLAGLRVPGGVGEMDLSLVSAAERLSGAAARWEVASRLPATGPALLVRDELDRDRVLASQALAVVVRLALGAEAGEAAKRLLTGSLEERDRAIALELVDASLSGSARGVVTRVLEAPDDQTRGRLAVGLAPSVLAMEPAQLLKALRDSDDDWMARCARWALDEGSDKPMLTLMEQILFLRQVDLFRDLPGRDLAVIAQGTQETGFPRGHGIFEEGAPGDALFLITQGSVAVMKGSGPERRIVAILGERECFGEMAILTGEPRSASVEAVEDVQALAISRQGFRDLIVEHPHIAFPIFEMLARRLKETTERYHERLRSSGLAGD